LSAVVYHSPNPERLADFYRRHLGIPFEHGHHGPMRDHLEAWFEGTHFAVLKGPVREAEGGGVSPTFRVKGIERFIEALAEDGVRPKHKVADLGEGKRLVSFRDLDGNVFSLIDLGF
jgi:catechol 2,3-dioxygenase-like lactoylglutathione lyase family enzyme